MSNYWDTYWRDVMDRYPTWEEARAAQPIPEWGEEIPEASYSLWRRYLGGTSPYQSWLGRDYGRYRSDYLGAALLNPTLQWQDYLGTLDTSKEWRYTAPYERGERPSAFAGRARWVP